MSYFSRYLSRDYQRGIQTGSTRKTNNAIELQVISENNGLFTKLFSFIFGHVIIAVWKERVGLKCTNRLGFQARKWNSEIEYFFFAKTQWVKKLISILNMQHFDFDKKSTFLQSQYAKNYYIFGQAKLFWE